MADLRYKDKNNQKKEVSVSATGVISTSATMDETLFTIPEASLVTRAYVAVITPSGSSSDTVDIKVGSTIIGNEIDVGVLGVQTGAQAMKYFETGGTVTVVAGSDAPDTTGRIKVIVEYIETELTEGTYTD